MLSRKNAALLGSSESLPGLSFISSGFRFTVRWLLWQQCVRYGSSFFSASFAVHQVLNVSAYPPNQELEKLRMIDLVSRN